AQLLPEPHHPSPCAAWRVSAPEQRAGAVGLRPIRRRKSLCRGHGRLSLAPAQKRKRPAFSPAFFLSPERSVFWRLRSPERSRGISLPVLNLPPHQLPCGVRWVSTSARRRVPARSPLAGPARSYIPYISGVSSMPRPLRPRSFRLFSPRACPPEIRD